MKKFLQIFAFLTIVSILAFACTDPVMTTVQKETPKEVVPEVQKVTPVQIGLTKPVNNKTAYPDCDGGECEDYSFIIGVQIADSPTQNLEYRADTYSADKGQAAKNPSLIRAKAVYEILRAAQMDELEVHVFKGQIQQVWLKEVWAGDGQYYQPADLLWTKTPVAYK